MRTIAAKVTEAGFQKTVLEFAKMHGWRTAHFRPARVIGKNGKTEWRTAVSGDGKGFPDLILVRAARIVFAELKVPPNKPSDEQEDWLRTLRMTLVEVYLWHPSDWDQIERVLE